MRAFVCYSLGEETQWTGKEDKHWSVCVCVWVKILMQVLLLCNQCSCAQPQLLGCFLKGMVLQTLFPQT